MRLIRLPEVMNKTGLSRSSVYLKIGNGDFPQSVSIGDRSVAWVESEVDDWITSKVDGNR